MKYLQSRSLNRKSLRLASTLGILTTSLLFNACFLNKKQASGPATPLPHQRSAELGPKALQPVGRTRLGDDGLELISTAAHFSVQFTGSTCKATFALAKNVGVGYIQYELDGRYGERIKVEKGAAKEVDITAVSEGRHTLTIYKTTEATTGGILVLKIQAPDVQSFMPRRKSFIEFIGNSITCGAASDVSEGPCGTGVYGDHHNSYFAYGPRVARALNCEFIVNSVSGIGCYRNWNSDGPTMPQVYDRLTLNINERTPWDFSSVKPDVISIALGTNDLSNGDGKVPRGAFDNDKFVETYINFISRLKQMHPGVKIALLNSPMMKGEKKQTLETCLSRVKAGVDQKFPNDKPVALIYFHNIITPRGCTGHPSIEDHEIMAKDVTSDYKKLLSL
ncbi:SGNH/GDSL hydrolase family protein [Mucilaginibacter dorajii]|uniref:SGNH/GDSL hydrolase family protein n=1 Tax=Mucilaginibacter dorajii TaxID=692994 RepID=UPI00216724FC|nr:SGNH/GDSL hydrolase family protein [Mucilaginibacter dorajii]MCS3732435.1 lysophospholipase L1-like esterase [Mucilaginibacter dorajii]